MKRLAVAMLLLAACGGSGDVWPDVSTRYKIKGDAVTCDAPKNETWSPEGGSYTSGSCIFTGVSVRGENACEAVVIFERQAPTDPWRSTVFPIFTDRC